MATVRCWYCNTENDPLSNAGFCNRCGRKLENAPETGIVDAPVRPTEVGAAVITSISDAELERRLLVAAKSAVIG